MKPNIKDNYKFALLILLICLILIFLSSVARSQSTLEKTDVNISNFEKINQHLQTHYKLKIFKYVYLTGYFTKDFQDQMPKRTFTVFKTEF